MEEYTWKSIFESEILHQGINHVWSFCLDEHLQAQQVYHQSTFARFQCSSCERWWNSAKVHIMFLIRWDRISRCGTVKMKIYRQSCRRCSISTFQKPEISKENIRRVIVNLVSKIQSMAYGRNNRNPPLMPEIYSADVDGPHEKKHCEACQMQVCPWSTEHGGKTMIFKPQLLASSTVQEKTSWPYTNVSSRPAAAVHQSPDNEMIASVIILFFIFLIFVGLLLTGNLKQYL